MTSKNGAHSHRTKPDGNQVRAKIRELVQLYQYDDQVLLSFAEFVSGGDLKSPEPSMTELKDTVIRTFGCSSFKELKKDGLFQLFIQDNKLKMNKKSSWIKVYRKFVGLPIHEKNAVGEMSINGVDILRNFLPWKVLNLNPVTATAGDIKTAFNSLAKQHHPDHGGNPEVFERLKVMRDSLLAAY